MSNPISIPEEKVKLFLQAYSTWLKGQEKEQQYPDKERQKAEGLKTTLLNKAHLRNSSDETLIKEILQYSKQLAGPANIRLGEKRISENFSKLRTALLYLVESEEDPFKKAHQILEGDYKIPIFSKAFWTPLFQAQYPQMLPNWNNKTEQFFKELGINLSTSKLTTEDKYRKISEAFLFFQELDSELDFFMLDHLMHYGTAIEEGKSLLKTIVDPISETRYWQIAPGEGAALLEELINAQQGIEPPVYTKADALKDVFFDQEHFGDIISRLKTRKNIILQGPPGVGKTFIAKRIAYFLMGSKDETRILMIQFHQSYSYEDFVQGFRPNEEGKFTLRNGLFYEFCKQAIKVPDKQHVLIIDEINRGNLSKIFGEMLMLIEGDKRGDEFSVPLTYGNGNSDRFYIPKNLYLIGTMNTADRSLAMVDYALRRRFSFIDLEPQFKNPKFRQHLGAAGVRESMISRIVDKMHALNQKIAEDTKNLGPGYCIGHSYFCPTADPQSYDDFWYQMVIKFEIEPLLKEYWFDDPEKVADTVGTLLAGILE